LREQLAHVVGTSQQGVDDVAYRGQLLPIHEMFLRARLGDITPLGGGRNVSTFVMAPESLARRSRIGRGRSKQG
jgi:hypothetical protein